MSLHLFGGLDGVRDQGSFESAVMHPQNISAYEAGDVFEVAAGYAFHIAQAQSLIDGNKRTGTSAALVFLELNGWSMPEATDEIYQIVIGFADRRFGRKDLATLFRARSVRKKT